MSVALKSSSLNLERFRKILLKVALSNDSNTLPEISSETRLDKSEICDGIWPTKADLPMLRYVNFENWQTDTK